MSCIAVVRKEPWVIVFWEIVTADDAAKNHMMTITHIEETNFSLLIPEKCKKNEPSETSYNSKMAANLSLAVCSHMQGVYMSVYELYAKIWWIVQGNGFSKLTSKKLSQIEIEIFQNKVAEYEKFRKKA